MKLSRAALVTTAAAAVTCAAGVWAFQRTADFGFGDDDSPSNVKAEFYWSRLAYNTDMNMESYGAIWRPRTLGSILVARLPQGRPAVSDRDASLDANRGAPTEQVITLDSDEIFNYPWIYAVQVENWSFTDAEAKRLREYLLKGGFLMVDDFHGTEDWENFMNGMRQVLPDRPVEDLQRR